MVKPLPMSSLEQFERDHVRPLPGRTLIVGSRVYRGKEDRRKRYPDCVGIDMQAGEGVDLVQDLELPLPLGQVRSFDHVECMSVLEHSRKPWLIAANIERMLKVGGTLYVTVPFVWAVHGYPSDYFRFTIAGVRELFPSVEWSAAVYAERTMVAEVKREHLNGHPFFPRSEVCAFGVLVR